jgi:hypothetical protein
MISNQIFQLFASFLLLEQQQQRERDEKKFHEMFDVNNIKVFIYLESESYTSYS